MTAIALPKDAPATSEVGDRLARLNALTRLQPASVILETALTEFGRGLAYVSSFGAESAVMLQLIADADRAIPVIFIDTGMHFHQTLQYRDLLTDQLELTDVRTVHPLSDHVRKHDVSGNLHASDPDACCEIRKVAPLAPALEGVEAWITGRKRSHGGGRVDLPVFGAAEGRFKVNPLLDWGAEDIERFMEARSLPRHPLTEQGYPSVGCWPCTVRPVDPRDVRSGRWAGRGKTECGLHLERRERPKVF